MKIARESHAHTEFSKSKTTKIKRRSIKKRKSKERKSKEQKIPSPRPNPIRVKKYKGGKNIKIGRASRFENDNLKIPGPGDYFINSEFSRHAEKDF